jgi:hypothetical protein
MTVTFFPGLFLRSSCSLSRPLSLQMADARMNHPPYAVSTWLRDSFAPLLPAGWRVPPGHCMIVVNVSQPVRRRTTYRVRKGAKKEKRDPVSRALAPIFEPPIAFARTRRWSAERWLGSVLLPYYSLFSSYSHKEDDVTPGVLRFEGPREYLVVVGPPRFCVC